VSSFLGSGIAWLTSYTKADERLRHTHVLDQLIELLAAARKAATLEELDKLRADTDDILRKTILQAEQNALDEQALLAFSLALDQAQMAISDRRAMLTGHMPSQATAASMAEVTPLRFATP